MYNSILKFKMNLNFSVISKDRSEEKSPKQQRCHFERAKRGEIP